MKLKGILLPIYALPSKYGIGEFSNEAFSFIDSLKEKGFNAWQILPLNSIGYGHSPYQAYSSYALEEGYISLDDLYSRELISKPIPFNSNKNRVAYEDVIRLKRTYYLEAYFNYTSKYGVKEILEFGEKNPKVSEYAKFAALKDINKGEEWSKWSKLSDQKLGMYTQFHLFLQMILFQEWQYIKNHAEDCGIKLIGDLPFYVGYDSSDVYFHQDQFLLKDGKPTFVSGVGPDYFSEDGQLWGTPIYFIENMYKDGYSFLVDRILNASKLYDIIRLDHFRAFDTYYVIKAGEKTAKNGEWWECPGYQILDNLFSKKKDISLIAEDLGLLRKEVIDLRNHYNLPGMNVIQFKIFEQIKNEEDTSNLISYLGTHDNQTNKSFVKSLSREQKKIIKTYFLNKGIKNKNLELAFIEYLFKQENAIISFVDLLRLNDKCRINVPSLVSEKNWSYKLVNFDKLYKAMEKLHD